MIAPVGGMTKEAVFLHRRMGPHERTPLFGVALVAEIVNPVPFDHLVPETAVVIVAIRAFYFSFPDGMVGLSIFFRSDPGVADVAELRLLGLQVFAGHRMNGVTVIAGNGDGFVLAHVPEGQIAVVPVAGKSFG